MVFSFEAKQKPRSDVAFDAAPDHATSGSSPDFTYGSERGDNELSDAELGDLEAMGLESKSHWDLQQMTLDPQAHVRAAALAELQARDLKLRSSVKTRESGVSAEWKATPQRGQKAPGQPMGGSPAAEDAATPAADAPSASWRDLLEPNLKLAPRVQHERSKMIAGSISQRATSADTILVEREGTVEGTVSAHGEYSDGMLHAGGGAGVVATAYGVDGTTALGDDGARAMYGASVGKAQANAGATVGVGREGVQVSGSAGASVTMVGGHAKLQSAPITFDFLGEELRAVFTAGVKAEVLAEARGDVVFDVSKGETPTAGLTLGGEAFAGARAGVELGAEVKWYKNKDYTEFIKGFVKSLPGTPDFLVDRASDSFLATVERILVGNKVPSLIAGVKGGIDGSAGIGGSAGLNLAFSGGQITVDGHVSGTVGLGVGTHLTTTLDGIEGLRYLGMLGARGATALMDQVSSAASWFQEIEYEVLGEVELFLRERSDDGGIAGWASSAAHSAGDWLGAW